MTLPNHPERRGGSAVARALPAEFFTLAHRCHVATATPQLARWLRRCWEVESPPASATRSRLDFGFTVEPPWRSMPPFAFTDLTVMDGAALVWRRHGARWWSTGDERARVELRLVGQNAGIHLWGSDWTHAFTAAGFTGNTSAALLGLHVAMCETLRSRGFVPLHAAVVVRDGKATAVVGRRGVGKSSTLLALIEQGWAPLGEDVAWLDWNTRRVHAWSGEIGVRLTDEGLGRLPMRWRDARWRRARDEKLLLLYDDMSVPRTLSAELTRVVVLERDASVSTVVRPLPMRAAVRALWECAGVPLCTFSRDTFAAQVPLLLSRLEWATLVLGSDSPVV